MCRVWDRICEALTDFEYLQARIGAFDGPERRDPPCTVFDVLRDYLDALHTLPTDHPGRDAVAALHRALDADSHVLKASPDLLIQQVHNSLTREWGEGTDLGRGVRVATRRMDRPWLRRTNWPQIEARPALRRTLTGHKEGVLAVAFHPGGRALASHGSDETIRLWDIQTGQERAVLTDPRLAGRSGRAGRTLAFSPDGTRLVSVGKDGPLLWDPAAGAVVRALGSSGSPGDILVAFSPESTRLLTGGWLHDYCWWEAQTGTMLHRVSLGYMAGYSTSRALSPDGRLLASATGGLGGGKVVVCDAATFQIRWSVPSEASAVAFSPDGEMLAVGSRGGKLVLFAARTGAVLVEPAAARSSVSLAFSPDGSVLAAGDEVGGIAFWDLNRAQWGPTLLGHGRPVAALAFSPDGVLLASGEADGAVRIWDVTTRADGVVRAGHNAPLTAAAFSPNGAILVSGSSAAGHDVGEVKLWDVGTGQPLRDLRAGPRRMLDWMDYEYEGRPGDVNVLAFSHAGDLVAEGADDGSLRVWDVATGELLSSAAARHNGRVTDLRFAPDDRTLVFWTSARWVGEMLDIFHLQEGTSRPLQNSPGTLAFSADGTLLAVSSPEGGVRLWVAHRGTEAMHFDTGKPVASLLFSADNLLLSASAPDGEEWVWEVRTGERVANAIRTHAFPAPGTWRPVWAGKRLEIREPRTDAVLGWTPFDHTIVAVWVTPDGARLRVADNGGSSHRPNIHLLEVVGFSKSNCA